jgi:hypothetical protein
LLHAARTAVFEFSGAKWRAVLDKSANTYAIEVAM